MTWQLFILASVLSYSTSAIFQRVVMKDDKTDPAAVSILSEIIITALLAGYGFLVGKPSLSGLGNYIVPLLILTVLYAVGFLAQQKALKRTEAANFTIIFSFRAVVTAFLSVLFLKEMLIGKHIVGAALILCSIIIVNVKKGGLSFRKEDLLSLFVAICYGAANTNDRFILRSMDLYTYLPIAFLLPGLFTMLLKPSGLTKIRPLLSRSIFPKFLIWCVLYAISALTFFAALQIAPSATQVSLIGLTSTICIVILAALFIGERDHLLKKLIAAGLSVAGAMLLV